MSWIEVRWVGVINRYIFWLKNNLIIKTKCCIIPLVNNLVKTGEKYMKKKLKVLGISVLSLILVLSIGVGMIFKGNRWWACKLCN